MTDEERLTARKIIMNNIQLNPQSKRLREAARNILDEANTENMIEQFVKIILDLPQTQSTDTDLSPQKILPEFLLQKSQRGTLHEFIRKLFNYTRKQPNNLTRFNEKLSSTEEIIDKYNNPEDTEKKILELYAKIVNNQENVIDILAKIQQDLLEQQPDSLLESQKRNGLLRIISKVLYDNDSIAYYSHKAPSAQPEHDEWLDIAREIGRQKLDDKEAITRTVRKFIESVNNSLSIWSSNNGPTTYKKIPNIISALNVIKKTVITNSFVNNNLVANNSQPITKVTIKSNTNNIKEFSIPTSNIMKLGLYKTMLGNNSWKETQTNEQLAPINPEELDLNTPEDHKLLLSFMQFIATGIIDDPTLPLENFMENQQKMSSLCSYFDIEADAKQELFNAFFANYIKHTDITKLCQQLCPGSNFKDYKQYDPKKSPITIDNPYKNDSYFDNEYQNFKQAELTYKFCNTLSDFAKTAKHSIKLK